MDRELVLFAAEPKAAIALPSAHEDADDDEDQAALMTRIMAAHGQPSTYSSVLPSARDASTGQGDSALLRDVMKQQQQRREIEERMAHVPKSMREQMQQQMQPKYSKVGLVNSKLISFIENQLIFSFVY
jgi:hypothetical protein